MIPISHSYIVNFLANRADLSGLGNSVRITVESTEGEIFTAEFQETLRQITDEVFYVNGVDRAGLQSLWTPNVRWQEVTEEGFVGGSVIPDDEARQVFAGIASFPFCLGIAFFILHFFSRRD